ncbi:MAG TPA: HAD-IIIC family phosphatase [Polyangiaceae bacterium]|jgi:exopolysaccharide biosynthesis WecB/TagA/CpsF family protein
MKGALAAVERLVDEKKGGTVFTPNVDHIVLAEHDASFREVYERASLSLVDGMPVLWAARALGAALPEKVSGSDFVPALVEVAAKRGFSVYLLGGAPGSAERAAQVLEARGVRVVGLDSPRVPAEIPPETLTPIVDAIRRASPDLVLVGLGAPKQERLADAIADRVRPAVLLGVGATIDFLAGAVERAPRWMSESGLEWLYRLGREPRRLWRRYLLRDPEFALVVARQMRERHGGPSELAEKVIANATARSTAALHLRDFDRVGARARTRGKPVIENLGTIEVGDDFQVNCAFAPVRFVAGPGAEIRIGDGLNANFGVDIAATERVALGSRVSLGPYVAIRDGASQPIEIGDDVWLAARVRIAPGVTIGAGTVVTAGSVVDRSLPPNVVAGGAPARVLRSRSSVKQPQTAIAPKPARTPDAQGIVLADFTADDLARALEREDPLGPVVAAEVAPFDQVVQTLDGLAHAAPGTRDFAFVWTRPERVSPAFARLLAGESAPLDAMLADVDAFADRLLDAVGARHVFAATWTLPPHVRGLGMIDLRSGGVARALAAMNLRLAEKLEPSPKAFALDASRWMVGVREPYSARLWYMGKVGFARDVLDAAAHDVRAALRGLRGQARKLIVLDLDDTLWGGIVGDVGWQNLRLGGHDPVGESFVDFQRAALALSRRGIALAVVSKNEESVALEAMREHPEMVLRPEHLAGWRINWRDKAQNVAELVAELNLGLQSVVFIDDNPIERARVREALPEVLVPEWPEEKTRYVEALAALRCFDSPTLSAEDAARTQMYAQERERAALKSKVGSLDEWLEGLGTVVRFAPVDATNLPRTAQLLNKTNQMNLRTRRLSEAELLDWSRAPGRELWAIHVSDKLGEAGLTGILGLELADDGAVVVADYVLSCRVMGRRVEETVAWFATERAKARGATVLRAPYQPTAKNKPCLNFFESLAPFAREGDVFVWNETRPIARPNGIRVEIASPT